MKQEKLSKLKESKSKVFAAGAVYEDGKLKTSGGRVLSLVSIGSNLEEAIKNTYDDIHTAKFEGAYYRKDIGKLYR